MKSIMIKLEHIPYIVSSIICGFLVGGLIFVFKSVASAVISLSEAAYSFVRANPIYLPLMILLAAALGMFASYILKIAPEGRGGGIPTAISVIRGLVSFSWLKSLLSMFTSAMLTYLCAVPLGNEGPSVQMGTALGRGCVRLFKKEYSPWDRYVMTGGASAGFASATGAPLTGILFAFEEAHRRFSPLLFCVSCVSAVSACSLMKLLCDMTDTPYSLFHFPAVATLPAAYMPIAIIVGLACGACAVLLSKGYVLSRKILSRELSKIPFTIKMVIVFALVSVFGVVSAEFVGSGHHVVDELILGHGVWYMLLIVLLVRAVLLLFANNVGVTGGLFVPTLAFGALSGALVGKFLVFLRLLPDEYYPVAVIMGIAAVLAAFSHTPLMAIAFSLEVLGAVDNILPIIIGVAAAYVFVEKFAAAPFTDLVIEAKVEDAHRGKEGLCFECELVVMHGSFIIGKEIRDVLWPPMCVVSSLEKNRSVIHREGEYLCEGDRLSMRFISYDLDDTIRILESFVGKQTELGVIEQRHNKENDIIPEL